jgi:hypothetical protein
MYTNLVIYKVFLRYSREVLLFDLKVFVKNGTSFAFCAPCGEAAWTLHRGGKMPLLTCGRKTAEEHRALR